MVRFCFWVKTKKVQAFIKLVCITQFKIYRKWQKVSKEPESVTKMVWYTATGRTDVLGFLSSSKKNYSPKFVVSSIKSKKVVCRKLRLLNLSIADILTSCKEWLLKYQKSIILKHQQFIDEHVGKYKVDVITFIDSEAMYMAFGSEKSVAICSLKLDSVGLEAHCRKIREYDKNS